MGVLWRRVFLCAITLCSCLRPAVCSVPKVIWAFWHDHDDLSASIQLARASWEAFAPEYTVNFLDGQTWRDHVTQEQSRCGEGRTFAEWLRLRLLAQHGGVWLDASIILTAPLDLLIHSSAQISGVDIKDGMNFETSFIASVAHCSTMSLWLQEYEKICDMSDAEYMSWLVKQKINGTEVLNGQYADCDWGRKSWLHGLLESVLHLGAMIANCFIRYTNAYAHPCGEGFWVTYLKINTSLNAVLGMKGMSPKDIFLSHGIYTQPTETTLMLVPHLQGYDDDRVALYLRGRESKDIDIYTMRGVKLTSGDRKKLDAFRTCEEGSIICRVQEQIHADFFQKASLGEHGSEL